ncbi:MAG TPA: ABC transporter ATP-binding protein [Psychromonas hadalis]|nr:ABC transporter ATP-binding protein [Psychromonas hadalis]
MKNTILKIAIALLISSCSIASIAQEQTMTLMLDWFVNPSHGPIIVAQQKGYFKEEGLNVVIQEPADPSLPPKLVAAGKLDLAVSYQNMLTINVAAGLPLIRSATLISTPLSALMVLDNGKIKTLADLKGKTIGISAPGDEDVMIGRQLKEVGLTMSDVKIVNVGWALSSSLASGKVDAIWGGFRNFEINELALKGFKVIAFYPEEHGVPPYDELVFIANSKSYDAKKLKKFNHAIERASQFIVNHPKVSWAIFKDYKPKVLDTKLNALAWDDSITRFALRPAAIDLGRYDLFAQFLFDHGLIKALPKAKDYVPVL